MNLTRTLSPGTAADPRGLRASLPGLADVALLVARIGVGVVFAAHGWQKLVTQGLAATSTGFEKMGVPLPAASAWYACVVELVAGLALVVGLAVPVAGILLVLDMLGAFVFVHAGNGVFVTQGGFELVVALGMASLLLAVFGSGRFALDEVVSRRSRVRSRMGVAPGRPDLTHEAPITAAHGGPRSDTTSHEAPCWKP